MKTIVAVDPGVSGGIAVRNNEGQIVVYSMPDSVTGMRDLLAFHIQGNDREVWIEEIPKFTGRMIPSSRIAVMFENFGQAQGLAIGLGYVLNRVRPVDWQEPLGLGGKKSCADSAEWKRKLRSKAAELYPNLDVTLKTADALLILRYAMSNKSVA